MDILQAIQNVTETDIEVAVTQLNKELAELQFDIVQFCADGDVDCAGECLAQYDRVAKLKEFVCSLKNDHKED